MQSALLLLSAAAAIVATCLVAPAAPAQAAAPIYAWCWQPSGPRGPDCYYATIDQCRAAASAAGFCYQNPAATAATQGRPDRMRR